MANITAADVNKLRQMTGAGMMDCKKALVEANGDFDAAIDYLRKKGQKVASSRADRAANEGMVLAKTSADSKKAIIVMISCETDFVAKSQDFMKLTTDVAEYAINNTPGNIDELKAANLNGRSVQENLTDLIGKVGEKMEVARYQVIEAARTYAYNHPGNRLGTIVGFNKDSVEGLDMVGKEIAMQIAAMSPVAIDKSDVTQEMIDKEIEIGKEQARQEGKPEEMLEKIAQGKLNKFFKESTLLNQEFVRDNKKTVGQYITEIDKDLKVTAFARLMLGA
ncbi:MAG TPA: translation elongation factor Ts [Bacteroidales bacterium]|nr:translation elongation factor Ts [Bacteroidales bacterium]HPS18000.1 translation elongation factor Ts [Bacteroidales bacterium]